MYHADSSFIGNEDALGIVAEAILKLSGDTEKGAIDEIMRNPQTLPALKEVLKGVLDPQATAAARALAEKKRKEAEAAAIKAREEAKKAAIMAEEANRPYYLSVEQVNQAVNRGTRHLRPCIKAALERRAALSTVRLTFTIDGTRGTASGLKTLPGDIAGLENCLSEGMSHIVFPLFKKGHQTASYTIRITGNRRGEIDSDKDSDTLTRDTETETVAVDSE